MSFALEEGAVIGGRYRLDHRIGEGGMGVVWAATNMITKRALALKFLKQRGLDDGHKRRLIREAQAACAINHPGVVPVLDVLESDDGEPALVMELLEGESLAARLARSRLSLSEAASILTEVCHAVAAAHSAGVVHRDLKPENVFLTKHEGARVLDFGVAKLTSIDEATARSAGTQTGALLGTPHYMSPEQAFGERDVDHRSDIWSLGLLSFECLSGELPTRAANVGQILKIIIMHAVPPLAERARDVPPEICAMVDRMISNDREARPTLSEVVDAFAPLCPEPRLSLSGRFLALPKEAMSSLGGPQREAGSTSSSPVTTASTARSVSSFGRKAAGTTRRWLVAATLLPIAAVVLGSLFLRSPSGAVSTSSQTTPVPGPITPSGAMAPDSASALSVGAAAVPVPQASVDRSSASEAVTARGLARAAKPKSTAMAVVSGTAGVATSSAQKLQDALAKDTPF